MLPGARLWVRAGNNMGIHIKQKGNFSKTLGYLDTIAGKTLAPIMKQYGEKGVRALSEATPKDSGKTAESWKFKMEEDRKGSLVISWYNTNTNEGANVAILLQYGHVGPGDVYVEGRDYINPAIQPVINEMKHMLRNYLKGLTIGAAHFFSGI